MSPEPVIPEAHCHECECAAEYVTTVTLRSGAPPVHLYVCRGCQSLLIWCQYTVQIVNLWWTDPDKKFGPDTKNAGS